jgi:hypothetical protein
LLGDDRALMEEFFNVLTARCVRIQTSDQAVALGTAVADIARALGMVDESVATAEVVTPAGAGSDAITHLVPLTD